MQEIIIYIVTATFLSLCEEQKRYEQNKRKKQKESLSSRLASAERILMHFFAAFLLTTT